MLVKRIKNRGATIVVEAHGEILMMPSGDIGRWKQRFTQRVKQEVRKEAPTNKRPRWGHYGKALKTTFTSSTSTRLTKGGGFIYSAIGSTAPHAWYVDQGTGIYNGGAPYRAKVLPPWTRGGPSLYEHTWRPLGPGGKKVKPVMIKGQKGQKFFDKGLDRAFRSVGDARYKAVGGAVGAAMRSFPEGLANFKGNTPNDGAFKASLAEWRLWRDEAWGAGKYLGERGGTKDDVKYSNSSSTSVENINRNRYLQSLKAAEKRKKQSIADAKARKARAAEKKRLADEKQAKITEKNKIIKGNVRMKREATNFYETIKKAYPTATFGQKRLPDGTMVYQVTYTMSDGQVVRRRWAYGYDTD